MAGKKGPNAVFGSRITSILSISLVLYTLGVIGMVGIAAREITKYIKENISFSVVLSDTMTPSQIDALKNRLTKASFTREVTYISKEQALKELTEELGANPETFLGKNPMTASFEVYINEAYANIDSIDKIQKQLRTDSNIRDMIYQRQMIELVNRNVEKALWILVATAMALTVISLILIFNTVRLTIYARRFAIYTMRLVGAKDAFITSPFVYQNLFNGLVSSILSIGAIIGSLYYLNGVVPGVMNLFSQEMLIINFVGLVVVGLLINAVAAYVAVTHYLHMSFDKMFRI